MLTKNYLAAYERYKLEVTNQDESKEQFMKIRKLFNDLLEETLSRMESAGTVNPQSLVEEEISNMYSEAQWRVNSHSDKGLGIRYSVVDQAVAQMTFLPTVVDEAGSGNTKVKIRLKIIGMISTLKLNKEEIDIVVRYFGGLEDKENYSINITTLDYAHARVPTSDHLDKLYLACVNATRVRLSGALFSRTGIKFKQTLFSMLNDKISLAMV